MRKVVVVGGGASGAAVAIHLVGRAAGRHPGVRVDVVERSASLGRGVAYAFQSPVFRLNVPAAKMSLYPHAPRDFVDWAGAAPDAFLPRARYGEYVAARFADAVRASTGNVRVVRGEAVAVDARGVHLADGTHLDADAVVLATGIAPRIAPSPLPADPRILDAWDEAALATLPREGRVLVLGAGLSALDVVALCEAQRFGGTLDILSRRGLLPRPHLAPGHPPVPLAAEVVDAAPSDLRGLARWAREVIAEYERRGHPWQLAVDALRPHVARLYRRMPPADRARFVRSVRPYWDVLRHRAPPEALALVDALRARGRLDILSGRIVRCEPVADGLDVELAFASSRSRPRRQRYDRIVRCIGPALEPSEAETPLVRALVASGIAAADPAGLGLVTDEVGRVVDASGVPSERVFAIGAVRRASSWETTAMPDISVHALELAERILP